MIRSFIKTLPLAILLYLLCPIQSRVAQASDETIWSAHKTTDSHGQQTEPKSLEPLPAPEHESSVERKPHEAENKFEGLFDLYYSYNRNRPRPALIINSTLPDSQAKFRNFDMYHNQISLNLAELTFKHETKSVILKLDLDFGQIADETHRDPLINEVSKHIGQAVLSYTPVAIPNLTLNFGKMATHLGLETLKSKENWQYSRSFLWTLAIPYWHVGVNASYAVIPGKMSIGAYVYNGWNTYYENNSGKTLGFQLAATPTKNLALNYNLISGPEQAVDNMDRKTVHEVNATWTVFPDWTVAIDGMYGKSSNEVIAGLPTDVTWSGASLALKHQICPSFYVSPRGEFYRDAQGFTTKTGVAQTLDSVTLTASWLLAEGLETRLEVRRDHSTAPTFVAVDGSESKLQMTGTLGLLYSF